MAQHLINGVDLRVELLGRGPSTIVLVHGSWTDHHSWQLVAEPLARRHRVVTYDRRGHSHSGGSPSGATRRHEEDDLAGLIEMVEDGPVHLVGSSYGASIALGLARRRPNLVRSVVAHEPPLFGSAVGAGPGAIDASLAETLLAEVGGLIRSGDHERAAELFIEQVALGPGTWRLLPEDSRRIFVANAPAFLDTIADPCWADVPGRVDRPVLLTDGDRSPAWLLAIVEAVASTIHRDVARHTFVGAGHVPHLTHPGDVVAAVDRFVTGSPVAGPTS